MDEDTFMAGPFVGSADAGAMPLLEALPDLWPGALGSLGLDVSFASPSAASPGCDGTSPSSFGGLQFAALGSNLETKVHFGQQPAVAVPVTVTEEAKKTAASSAGIKRKPDQRDEIDLTGDDSDDSSPRPSKRQCLTSPSASLAAAAGSSLPRSAPAAVVASSALRKSSAMAVILADLATTAPRPAGSPVAKGVSLAAPSSDASLSPCPSPASSSSMALRLADDLGLTLAVASSSVSSNSSSNSNSKSGFVLGTLLSAAQHLEDALPPESNGESTTAAPHTKPAEPAASKPEKKKKPAARQSASPWWAEDDSTPHGVDGAGTDPGSDVMMTSQRPSSQAGRFIPKRVPFDPSPQVDHRLGKEGKAIVLSPAGQHLVALTQSLLDQPAHVYGSVASTVADVFGQPVPILKCQGYRQVLAKHYQCPEREAVDKMMDLGTLLYRLRKGLVVTVGEWLDAMVATFTNAIVYWSTVNETASRRLGIAPADPVPPVKLPPSGAMIQPSRTHDVVRAQIIRQVCEARLIVAMAEALKTTASIKFGRLPIKTADFVIATAS